MLDIRFLQGEGEGEVCALFLRKNVLSQVQIMETIFFLILLSLCLSHVLLDAIFFFYLYLVQASFGNCQKPHQKHSDQSIPKTY